MTLCNLHKIEGILHGGCTILDCATLHNPRLCNPPCKSLILKGQKSASFYDLASPRGQVCTPPEAVVWTGPMDNRKRLTTAADHTAHDLPTGLLRASSGTRGAAAGNDRAKARLANV